MKQEQRLYELAETRARAQWGVRAEENLGAELFRAVVAKEVLAIIAAQANEEALATRLASYTFEVRA